MRVLHFPSNTGNHPAGLAAAERELGLDSTVVTVETNPFYRHDRDLVDLDLAGRSPMRRWLERMRFGRQAVDEYDVFHFNKGETFLPGSLPVVLDLAWLKSRGKRVVVTFQGSDARPHISGAPKTRGVPPRVADAIRATRIRQIVRWADQVWCLNPDLLSYVPDAELLAYASVDVASIEPTPPGPHGGPLRVVHAPSNRRVKGTEAVLQAVAAAANEIDIELDLIEGVAHPEAMRRVRRADVAVDQMILGWYGGFAVEAMAMAKPTIAHIDPAHRPPDLPIVDATTDTLAEKLIELSRLDLGEIGARSRSWVEVHHDPRRIVKLVIGGYRG